MQSRCLEMARKAWKLAGYTRKDISVVSCAGNFFVETPKSEKEVSAHCKWCALTEVICSED